MKRILSLSLLAALSGACGSGSQGDMATNARAALPSKDAVKVGAPSAAAGTIAPPHQGDNDSQVGDASVWAATTESLAVSVNGGVIWALGIVEIISALPPTSCTATSCVWGPGSGALETVNWKLNVEVDASTDVYTWALSGEPKATAGSGFVAVISGTSKPSELPHRGTGHFTIDFDAAKTLNPANTDIGQLQIAYSNATPGQGTLTVSFLGVKDNDHPGQTLNALYSFKDQSGGGDLDIAWHNTTSNDRLSLHSRWLPTGAGRSDVNVSVVGSASSAYTASASECWSALLFKVVFFDTSDAAHLGADAGVESDCAFSPAAFSTQSAP